MGQRLRTLARQRGEAEALQLLAQVLLDQRLRHPLRQTVLGEFLEGPREGRRTAASCSRAAGCGVAAQKVASGGSFLHPEKPRMRSSLRSTVSRSIKATVVGRFKTALATNAFANQAHSWGGRPMPHHESFTNSSILTHSRMWISRSSFGVSAPQRSSSSGIGSYCTTFQRYMIRQGVLSFDKVGAIRVPILMPEMAACHFLPLPLSVENLAVFGVLQEARLF